MIQKIEPPYWWNSFENKQLQLMVYGQNISQYDVKTKDADHLLRLDGTEITHNPNYLFINFTLKENISAEFFTIQFFKGEDIVEEILYELKERNIQNKYKDDNLTIQPKDVVYLIMPDRFSKGGQFKSKRLFERENRDKPFGRHGGDLQGIIDNIDYVKDLGCSTLWLTPVLENNAKEYSYHGYGITDYYQVDERLGSNDLYLELSQKLHQNKMKLIKDVVFNHIGIQHKWLSDIPDDNWLNNQLYIDRYEAKNYLGTNYHVNTSFDPYASSEDKISTQEGWFTDQMPDLNQNHPLLAKYLIQNTIWWIEYAQLDGLRVDTFGYVFKEFNDQWCKAILKEYPSLYIVAEVLVGETSYAARYNTYNKHNTSAVTDLPLAFTACNSFSKSDKSKYWESQMLQLYNQLSQDFLHKNPYQLLTCLDNHDITRVFSKVKTVERLKLAIGFLLTTRGIPQLYYGTELLFEGEESDHSSLRNDFPGGWDKDKVNAFTAEGRSDAQNEIWNFISKLLKWRKNAKAIAEGKLVHFIPLDEVYVYFRISKAQSIIVLINNNDKEEVKIDFSKYKSCVKGYEVGKNILSNLEFKLKENMFLSPLSISILELK
ncbi:cyclomaltodextrinase N-terminal domain-containing protein [Flammeovirga yaeyamensis]|uniref:Cyclomaltodextrinase N-terminal domain-containing protein n=1 Tax=Flammeovirga yaeyamensis TaxID=367791 RepID=A0AAX1MZD5_9BACT|nr:alpha-amylase family glycosyl hydrolase [Flammeovirga yaeyamensis]MBB3700837.1 glycosidase [Flammeovirga yaeyamensis]NMF37945.1 alpha-amylase [Flammeovirga yaeyamensis]QWG00597.1 cyclomaltodextrinase N-terminal domain-containing protein [Flammeovirga yaeyamensis]